LFSNSILTESPPNKVSRTVADRRKLEIPTLYRDKGEILALQRTNGIEACHLQKTL
jgi:hypothetical protein